MEEVNQITEQLQQIYSSLDNLSYRMQDINNSILNIGNGIEGLFILIVLLCINGNIKKLTQAIRENKKQI